MQPSLPPHPPQQQADYPRQQLPCPQQPQGYFPPMQQPVAAPRQNPVEMGIPQNSGNPQQHQTIIKTEVNLAPLMQNLGISQNEEKKKHKTPTKSKPKLKCKSIKSEQVDYGVSYTTMATECGSWFSYFAELRHNGKLKLSTYSKETKEFQHAETLKINKDWYVCIQKKKFVCMQHKDKLHVLKPKSEASCEKWLHALSGYASAGPSMSGYAEKFRHSKNLYHKYFIRLKSNGALDWFNDHLTADSYWSMVRGANSIGCIQVRGTTSKIDSGTPQVVAVRVAKKDYKFKFRDDSEANAWLQAFQFYSDKRQLKNSKFKNS